MIAWSDRTLDALSLAGLRVLDARGLKATYRKEVPGARGPLADQVARAGLAPPAIAARGRAAREVADVCALLEHLSRG